jgi:hypothetical protein
MPQTLPREAPRDEPRTLRSSLGWLALIAGIALISLWPVWTATYLPHQDGPAHLYNVKLLRDIWSGADPAAAAVYQVNDWWLSTWFGHLLVYLLSELTSYLTAQKLVVSAYLLALPASLAYASRTLGGDAVLPAAFGFALASGHLLNLGFYMFCFSLPVAIVLVGYWARRAESPGPGAALVFAALGLLLYYTHIVTLVMTALATAVMTLAGLVADRRIATPRLVLARTGWPLLGWLPALALLATFLLPRETVSVGAPELVNRVFQLAALTAVVSLEYREFFVSGALSLLLGVSVAVLLIGRMRSPRFARSDIWLLVALVWLAVYLAVPETELVSERGMQGGRFMVKRLQLFPVFAIVLWVAAQPLRASARGAVIAMVAVLAVALAGMRIESYREADSQIAEYVGAGALIEPGASLLPLYMRTGAAQDADDASDARDLLRRVARWAIALSGHRQTGCGRPPIRFADPYRHASGYLALEHGVRSLDNYEANVGYFPLVFRPGRNPYRELGNFELVPPEARFGDPGSGVDYVLVWRAGADCPLTPELVRELAGFEHVASSQPRGLADIYRRAAASRP